MVPVRSSWRDSCVVSGAFIVGQCNAGAPAVHTVSGLGSGRRALDPDLGGIAPDVQGGVIPLPTSGGTGNSLAPDVGEETVGIPIV